MKKFKFLFFILFTLSFSKEIICQNTLYDDLGKVTLNSYTYLSTDRFGFKDSLIVFEVTNNKSEMYYTFHPTLDPNIFYIVTPSGVTHEYSTNRCPSYPDIIRPSETKSWNLSYKTINNIIKNYLKTEEKGTFQIYWKSKNLISDKLPFYVR